MDEYEMNEFEMLKKADVMRIINAENAVVLNNLKERSTDEVLCAIVSQINGLQTIEAEPVRHGRWEYDDVNDLDYCSECNTTGMNGDFPYCPWCGAKMDGGAENG